MYLFYYWHIIAYNVALLSSVQKGESAISIHKSSLSWISLPPLYVITGSIDFDRYVSIFIFLQGFFGVLFYFFNDPLDCLVVCCLNSMCVVFEAFFYPCNLMDHGQKRQLIWIQYSGICRDLFCGLERWSILETIPSALEKNVCSVAFGWNFLCISVKSNCLICHLKQVFPY